MDTYLFAERPAPAGAPLLLLLHGTGGDEHDLLHLGGLVMPGAHLVSPRGDVSERGAMRFFRRSGMGVYDMDDLARATRKLGLFVEAQRQRLAPVSVAALGYSNGANLLASLLFTAPALVDQAVLMHPLIPFDPAPQPQLKGRGVLITAGRNDPLARWSGTERLSAWFEAQGAEVDLFDHSGGHELGQEEISAARRFLAA